MWGFCSQFDDVQVLKCAHVLKIMVYMGLGLFLLYDSLCDCYLRHMTVCVATVHQLQRKLLIHCACSILPVGSYDNQKDRQWCPSGEDDLQRTHPAHFIGLVDAKITVVFWLTVWSLVTLAYELNRSGTCHRSLERLNRVTFCPKKESLSKKILHCAAYAYYETNTIP